MVNKPLKYVSTCQPNPVLKMPSMWTAWEVARQRFDKKRCSSLQVHRCFRPVIQQLWVASVSASLAHHGAPRRHGVSLGHAGQKFLFIRKAEMIEAFSTPPTSPPPLPSSPSVTASPAPTTPPPSASITISTKLSQAASQSQSNCNPAALSLPFFPPLFSASVSFPATDSYIFRDKCSPWIFHLLPPPHPPGGFSNFLSVLHSPSPLLFIPMSIHLSSLEPSHVRHSPSPLLSPSLVFPCASFHSSVPLILPLLSANLMHFTWLESFPSYQSISSPTSPILISYSKSLHLSVEMSIL